MLEEWTVEDQSSWEQTKIFVVHRVIQPLYEWTKNKSFRHWFCTVSIVLPLNSQKWLHNQAPNCIAHKIKQEKNELCPQYPIKNYEIDLQ
jgi:hypothetical protein